MDTLAVVVEEPGRVALRRLGMAPAEGDDLVVAVEFSGISMGTEKLMFNGSMPAFPGMGYPLVPGYEAVGRVVDAGPDAQGAHRRTGVRAGLVQVHRRARPVRRLGADADHRLAAGCCPFPKAWAKTPC